MIAAIKEQKNTLSHLSLIARRGWLSHGAGAVKCFFPCPEAAERFLSKGLECLTEPTYVAWPDLLPSEMGPQMYTEMVNMCKNYSHESKLIVYVSICVVSETPAQGAVKWERQLVSRCAKMRLSKEVFIPDRPKQVSFYFYFTLFGRVIIYPYSFYFLPAALTFLNTCLRNYQQFHLLFNSSFYPSAFVYVEVDSFYKVKMVLRTSLLSYMPSTFH